MRPRSRRSPTLLSGGPIPLLTSADATRAAALRELDRRSRDPGPREQDARRHALHGHLSDSFTSTTRPPHARNGVSDPYSLRAGPVRDGRQVRFAERIGLIEMEPRENLCSTGCLLANRGKEYLAVHPEPGAAFTMTLEPRRYAVVSFGIDGRGTVEAGRRYRRRVRSGELRASDRQSCRRRVREGQVSVLSRARRAGAGGAAAR